MKWRISWAFAALVTPLAGFALGRLNVPAGNPSGEAVEVEKAVPARGPVSALPHKQAGSAAMLSRVAAHQGAGGFSKLMAYLKLVRAAEVSEFPELMERIEREVKSGEASPADMLFQMLERRWLAEDPLGALDAMLTGTPRRMLGREWAFLPSLSKTHPRETWQAIGEMEHYGRRRERAERVFFEMLAQTNPTLTLEFLGERNLYGVRNLLGQTLDTVAKRAPLETLAFVDSLPVGVMRQQGRLAYTVNGEYRVTRRLAGDKDTAAASVVKAWAQADPAAAIAWAETQEGSRRSTALTASVSQWGTKEPEAAMEYARANLGEIASANVFDKVLQNSQLSVDRRRTLVEAETESPTQTMGYYSFARDWIVEDVAGLSDWLAGHPGRAADALMKSAADHWAIRDHDAAVLGAAEIADPALRQIATETIAKRSEAQFGLRGVPAGEIIDVQKGSGQ